MKKIYAVGIGPGDLELLTIQAKEVLEKCSCIVGYKMYLEQIKELTVDKKVISGAMLQEVERCTLALEEVLSGEEVAVVSSGDAGVYGMAGLLMELCTQKRYEEIEVVVISGISAAISCAALVGAPFMNDFAVISLSNLLTPTELIKRRLEAVSSADMPVALYNPASKKRRELLHFAVETFRKNGGNLHGAIVIDAYREGQKVVFFKLDEFPFELVQMTTLVIICNSKTIFAKNQLFCRRGYMEKYGEK